MYRVLCQVPEHQALFDIDLPTTVTRMDDGAVNRTYKSEVVMSMAVGTAELDDVDW